MSRSGQKMIIDQGHNDQSAVSVKIFAPLVHYMKQWTSGQTIQNSDMHERHIDAQRAEIPF